MSVSSAAFMSFPGARSTPPIMQTVGRRIPRASIPAIRPKMVSSDSAAFDEVIEVIGKGGRFSDT